MTQETAKPIEKMTKEEIAQRREVISQRCDSISREIDDLEAQRRRLYDEDEELWQIQNMTR